MKGTACACAIVLFACKQRPSPAPAQTVTSSRFDASSPIEANVPTVLARDHLENERPHQYPPAVLHDCVLDGPVRSLALPRGARAVYATAIANNRAALAVSLQPNAPSAALHAQSATWLWNGSHEVEWQAGPHAPTTTSIVGGGTESNIVFASATSANDDRVAGRVSVTTIDVSTRVRTETVLEQPNPFASDLVCNARRCTLALGWVDAFAASELADQTGWIQFTPSVPNSMHLVHGPSGVAPGNALLSGADTRIGTTYQDGGTALHDWSRASATAGTPIDPRFLEVARIGSKLFGVAATAPSNEKCQYGAWLVTLHELDANGNALTTEEIARVDMRPRGVRIRRDRGDIPWITWLDSPQCETSFYVVRGWRQRHLVAIATAEDYDVASDEAETGAVAVALRRDQSIRWFRMRCAPTPRDGE